MPISCSRPLVVRFGALGDTVILTTLIRALHARFGEPVDVVGSGRYTQELLLGQPGVGDVWYIDSRRTPYLLNRRKIDLVSALRRRGHGPTWWGHVTGDRGLELLQRAGWTSNLICRPTAATAQENFSDQWLRFARDNPALLQLPSTPLPADQPAFPQLEVLPHLRSGLDQWLSELGLRERPLILVQAGNKRTMRGRLRARRRATNTKYWPEECWAAVLRGLRDMHPEHEILLLGTPNEAPMNDDILALAAIDHASNVARDLPISRLMALAERAAGLVSVDSGPAHVAAAVGCSVVVLFGKANPTFYCPRGPGASVTALRGERDGEASMLGIAPDAVLSAWRSMVSSCTESPDRAVPELTQ